jgi:hypothetical protein
VAFADPKVKGLRKDDFNRAEFACREFVLRRSGFFGHRHPHTNKRIAHKDDLDVSQVLLNAPIPGCGGAVEIAGLDMTRGPSTIRAQVAPVRG